MQYIKILSGIPACGKTKWAKEFMDNNPNYVRINRDDLRQHLVNNKYTPGNETIVNKSKMALIGVAIEGDKNIILDDTHCYLGYLQSLILYMSELSEQMGKKVNIEIIDFNIDLDTCIERNENREMRVDKKAIVYMQNEKKQIDYSTLNIDKYTVIDD